MSRQMPVWGDHTSRLSILRDMHEFACAQSGRFDRTEVLRKNRFYAGDVRHVYVSPDQKIVAIIFEEPAGHHAFLDASYERDAVTTDAFNPHMKAHYDAIDATRDPMDKVFRSYLD